MPSTDAAVDVVSPVPVALKRWRGPTTTSAAAMAMRWTAVRTHSQAERWASRNLQQAGYEVFLPMVTVQRRDRVVRSLWHSVEAPLFSGYLFVRHDPETSWTPIRTCPGVRCLLKCGNRLAYSSDMAIAGLQEALRGAEALAALPIPGRLRRAPGEAVEVRTGAFAQHPGVVLAVGKEMVLISLMVFGELREVMVQADNLVERVV